MRTFWSRSSGGTSAALTARSLDGQIAWVVGGAGIIGTGLVRGLLRAGAMVICNSRHKSRLHALTEELGHPEKLIAFQGSMLADGADDTVKAVMELTGGKLDHVVAHSAVRWWGKHNDGDETSTLQALNSGARGSLLDFSVKEFSEKAVVLPQMQFATARLLVPILQKSPNASYTFVTGGAGEQSRSPLGQINAQAVWGLAAAMRSEETGIKVAELRVGLRFNRPVEERRAEPRACKLSHDVGHICAGLAAAPMDANWENALYVLDKPEHVETAKVTFPAVDQGYSVFFSAEF